MSRIEHAPEYGERHHKAEVAELPAPTALPNNKRSSRWPTRQRKAWFTLLICVLLSIVTIFTLVHGSAGRVGQQNVIHSTTALNPIATAPPIVTVQAAQIRTYKVLPAGAGLMLPALDSQGNVWFGEMATNQLARLNAHTGVITAWVPPLGKYGIMAVTIDVQGNIWFAEQNANYIGRFTPTKQTFRIFPLGMVNGHAMGPEDLQFDASGKLWFTGVTSGQIGRLDPATGAIQMWPVPAPAANVQPYPYGLAVTAKGQIWFGSTSGGVVGHLDPMANRVTLYPLANSQEQIYSMATDTQGRIWFTELAFGVLGMIDTASGKVTELKVPTTLGNPEDLHSIAVSNGKVWFTSSGTNALVRYSPDDATYTFFQLPVPASVPFGLACDSKGKLWFTAAAEPVNYVGEMTP